MTEPKTDAVPLDVFEVMALMTDQLGSIAWQKMGLQPDMMTGKIEPDMDQCKAAIDAVAALTSLFESQLEEDDRRRAQNLVRDLRINFVEKSREAVK